MPTFKAQVFAHQKKRDGTYNIKIRVTHNRKSRYVATPWFVTKDDVTKSMRIKNQKYVDLTDGLIKKYRDISDRIGMPIMDLDVDQVVDILLHFRSENKFDLDFVAYTREYADNIEASGHRGTAKRYRTAVNSLVRFAGREQVSIFEITVSFLKAWCEWMKTNVSRGNGESASYMYTTTLKTMYRRAKREFNDEDAGIIRIPNSPFEHFVIPNAPIPDKRALSLAELRSILDYVPKKNVRTITLAQDVFKLSFCLIGMNPVDIYTCTDSNGGRITYQRTKTRTRRKDKAEISIKIEPEIEYLMKKYRDPFEDRVFNFYLHYSSSAAFDACVNRGLHLMEEALGIKKIQLYSARHTWATLAVNDVEVDKYVVHEALNHIDASMRVTDVYIRKNWKNIDKANRAVLDYVFSGN